MQRPAGETCRCCAPFCGAFLVLAPELTHPTSCLCGPDDPRDPDERDLKCPVSQPASTTPPTLLTPPTCIPMQVEPFLLQFGGAGQVEDTSRRALLARRTEWMASGFGEDDLPPTMVGKGDSQLCAEAWASEGSITGSHVVILQFQVVMMAASPVPTGPPLTHAS